MRSPIAYLVSMTLVVCLMQAQRTSAGPRRLEDFREFLSAARQLESAEVLSSDKPDEILAKRKDLVYSFVREPKSPHVDNFYEQLTKTVSDYRVKAYEHIEDSKKNKNWLGNLASKFKNPMSAMKFLSRFSKSLGDITERYDRTKDGSLTRDDVDCDMIKFQIRSLDVMMFVLQTDLKYLVTSDKVLVNRALYDKLRADKFASTYYFEGDAELTPKQRKALLAFYADRKDTTSTKVDEALDHFYEPGAQVVSRILDTCRVVPEYMSRWNSLESSREETCKKSHSDPVNSLFGQEFQESKYAEVNEFCRLFQRAHNGNLSASSRTV